MATVDGVNSSCKVSVVIFPFKDPFNFEEGAFMLANQPQNILELGTFSENHDVPRFASYTSDLSVSRHQIQR